MRRLRPVEALAGGRAAHVLELDSQAPHLRLSPTQLGREIVEQVLDRGHENRGVGAFLIKLALRVPSPRGHEAHTRVEAPRERSIEIVQILKTDSPRETVPRQAQTIGDRADAEIEQQCLNLEWPARDSQR